MQRLVLRSIEPSVVVSLPSPSLSLHPISTLAMFLHRSPRTSYPTLAPGSTFTSHSTCIASSLPRIVHSPSRPCIRFVQKASLPFPVPGSHSHHLSPSPIPIPFGLCDRVRVRYGVVLPSLPRRRRQGVDVPAAAVAPSAPCITCSQVIHCLQATKLPPLTC